MARLIPSFMDDRTPPGERDVFNLLASGPDDWVALHSLDLAPWGQNLRTEIDFVVIIPDIGILCIEVKSHEKILFDGDRWYPESIGRSPFKQASDARHILYRRLTALAPHLKSIPVVHCCIFPRAEFHITPNVSVSQWELMDSRTFRTFRTGDALCAALRQMAQKSISTDERIAPLHKRLTVGQVDEIIHFCVPVQTRRVDAREDIKKREEELEGIMREQQKQLFRLVKQNKKVVITGAAGTGKTLLAMAVAQHAAESGQRVALLCFNRLIGDWISRKMQGVNGPLPNLITGPAIRVMVEMAGLKVPDDPDSDYWENELPLLLEDRLTDPDFAVKCVFDYLVLDEAQDILARPHLWRCLQQFLRGGLQQGAFVLFGDFKYQILSDREPMISALEHLDADIRAARWTLDENCRNYPIVGNTAVQLAGLGQPVYSGYLRAGGSIQSYDMMFYESQAEQLVALTKCLRDFRTLGYKPSEITLLSFRADHTCAAEKLAKTGYQLRSVWQSGNAVCYSSIHAFKGMENKVIILTDVLLEEKEFHRDLFYIGMTRATEAVRVLCTRSSQAVLVSWLSGRSA